jgi:hypothetical protein
LGIGVRVASRVVRERVDAHAQQAANTAAAKEQAASRETPASPTSTGQKSQVEAASREAAASARRAAERAAQSVRQQAPAAAAKARGVGEGARRFGRALWGPFAHVSSVLWSEVTGVFFGLFAVYFAQGIFRYRAQYHAGPDHGKFVLDVALTLIFGYFALSSFYIARRKEKKKR